MPPNSARHIASLITAAISPSPPSARAGNGSALPSGRTTYRHLADFELELKLLAGKYPKLVRPITLNHKTHEGRDVVGIEIATHPNNVNDGKPVAV